MIAEPGVAENASSLGFGDALTVGMQLDIVTNAAAKSTRRVLNNRKTHLLSRFIPPYLRPDRTARRTFSPAPGRDSFPEYGGVGSGHCQSTPRAEAYQQHLPGGPTRPDPLLDLCHLTWPIS